MSQSKHLLTDNKLQLLLCSNFLKISLWTILVVGIWLYGTATQAAAKTITYQNQSWEVNPLPTANYQNFFVRSSKNLDDQTRHFLIGVPFSVSEPLLDRPSLDTIKTLETEINHSAVNAQFELNGRFATTFTPHQNGQVVDIYQLAKDLAGFLGQIDLPVVISLPQIKLADLNNLGITELIAQGESDFSGSSKNRIVNVTVGASKYNGVVLQPGEEFSFNQYLGDIDAAHGFKPEQVIKASGIELEFGGGLCQVSSTMFRAAMNAGFPITQRRNHSFAVHYYAPQGTDATIYPGSADLKFVNDYKTPVLVRTYLNSPHLYFEIYGTKDNRVVTFEGPVQFDKKSDGSMKATWTRHVDKNGQVETYVAKSTYVSPNRYKKVEQASTPNPQAVPPLTPPDKNVDVSPTT